MLILTGLELAAQIIVGNFLEFWSIHNSFCCEVEDWGIWLFFPLLFWALGCFFMFLFYRFVHTWSGSLPKKLENFDFQKECEQCCHCHTAECFQRKADNLNCEEECKCQILHFHHWCQQCRQKSSNIPDRCCKPHPRSLRADSDREDSLDNGDENSTIQLQSDRSNSSSSSSKVSMM